MAKYIALLRGVNVGRNLLKMDRLRALAAELGFKNVATYVQSGNLVFDADASPTACSQALVRKLAGETRLPVAVLLRTRADFQTVVARNPFLKEKGVDPARLHVTFLAQAATPAGIQKLSAIAADPDRFRVAGKEIYLHCPNGYGESKLSNGAIERALALSATTRNWNTVNKLYEMAAK
jgi:uncharacterized protein (DUF1697 family)